MSAAKNNSELMDNFFEAIDTIIGKRVSGLPYDTTILCQITDSSLSFEGKYTVTDNATEFEVYSENNTYKKGDIVYVTIPNGDMESQKLIIGKYVEEGAPYLYISPLENFVDISGNLIINQALENGLTANGNRVRSLISEIEIDEISKYDVLAFKANFRTLLKDYNILTGNYGIDISIMNNNTTITTLNFDSTKMSGDVYNFSSSYPQEMSFNISGIENIETANKIQVWFYQKGNFTNKNGLIPKQTVENGLNNVQEVPNLFVSDCYLGTGYSVANYYKDTVEIYCSDLEFTPDTEDMVKNYKPIKLRWIHKLPESDTMIVIDKADELPEEQAKKREEEGKEVSPEEKWETVIHYYHYNMDLNLEDSLEESKSDADKKAGALWEPLVGETLPTKEDWFRYVFVPTPFRNTERIKVIVEYPSKKSVLASLEEDTDYQELLAASSNAEKKDIVGKLDPFLLQKLGPEDEIDDCIEQLKTRIERSYLDQVHYYESNELVFTNLVHQLDPSYEIINDVRLTCDAVNHNGVYLIYDSTGKIIQSSESFKKRTFDLSYKKMKFSEESKETVKWYVPAERTMINLLEDGYSVLKDEDGNPKLIKRNGLKYFVVEMEGEPFTTTINEEDGEAYPAIVGDICEVIAPSIVFTVSDYYNPNTSNNNRIFVEITQDDYTATAEVELIFGTSGTNGTDYTFILQTDKYCFVKDVDETIVINPYVYDYNQDKIEPNRIDYSYKNNNNEDLKITKQSEDKSLTVSLNDFLDMGPFKFALIKATAYLDGACALNTYISIPVNIGSKRVESYDGANSIFYNETGVNPVFYKGSHKIYCNETKEDGSQEFTELPVESWEVWYDTNNGELNDPDQKRFYPSFSQDGTSKDVLVPTTIYFDDIKDSRVAIVARCEGELTWMCPLYIGQNVFTNATLNNWDGDLTIDEKNGTILSTMLGVGRKGYNNTFEGMILGDADNPKYSSKMMGLYGYNEGEQSFGFLTNGDAFIGKSGAGRILFEGDRGTITSSNYEETKNGIFIDLLSGELILSKQIENEKTKIVLSTMSDPYFVISDDNKDLIHVGKDEYYLQTADFDREEHQGLRFTLGGGDNSSSKFEAYNNFILDSFATNPFELKSNYTEYNFIIDKVSLYKIRNFLDSELINVDNSNEEASLKNVQTLFTLYPPEDGFKVQYENKNYLSESGLQKNYLYEAIKDNINSISSEMVNCSEINTHFNVGKDRLYFKIGDANKFDNEILTLIQPREIMPGIYEFAVYKGVKTFMSSNIYYFAWQDECYTIGEDFNSEDVQIEHNSIDSVQDATDSEIQQRGLNNKYIWKKQLVTSKRLTGKCKCLYFEFKNTGTDSLPNNSAYKKLSIQESNTQVVGSISKCLEGTLHIKDQLKCKKSIRATTIYFVDDYKDALDALEDKSNNDGKIDYDVINYSNDVSYIDDPDGQDEQYSFLKDQDQNVCLDEIKDSDNPDINLNYITVTNDSLNLITGEIVLKTIKESKLEDDSTDKDSNPLEIYSYLYDKFNQIEMLSRESVFKLDWNGNITANSFKLAGGNTYLNKDAFFLKLNEKSLSNYTGLNFNDISQIFNPLDENLIYFGKDSGGHLGARILNTININKASVNARSRTAHKNNLIQNSRVSLIGGDVGIKESLTIGNQLGIFGGTWNHGSFWSKEGDITLQPNRYGTDNYYLTIDGTSKKGTLKMTEDAKLYFYGKGTLQVGWEKDPTTGILAGGTAKDDYEHGHYNLKLGTRNVCRRKIRVENREKKDAKGNYVVETLYVLALE